MSSNNSAMRDEEISTDLSVQIPKKNDNESVDDFLDNVDQFIEGIYRDLSMSPPRRSSIGNTSNFSVRSPNISSILLSDTPVGAPSITPVKSPTTRRNMDAEIERINRICDDVDQNLRSVDLIMNNSPLNSISENILDTNLTRPSDSSTSIIIINNSSPRHSTIIRRNNIDRRSSPVRQVIDLSNTQTETPEMVRQPVRYINDDSDDVILVSADIPTVVDLCTPNGHQETFRSRPIMNYQQLNRRRLSQYRDAEDTCCEGPSSTRRRTTNTSQITEYNKPSAGNTKNMTNIDSSSTRNRDGHYSIICPVCMESCLQRCPTSTLCGHVFCKQCIEQAIEMGHKCPICNRKLTKKQIYRLYI